MLGESRYTNENTDDIFLAHYYCFVLYFDSKMKMVSDISAEHTGSRCVTWLVRKVTNTEDLYYPLKVARDLALRFKMFTKEDENVRKNRN